MDNRKGNQAQLSYKVRYRGRGSQVWIYLWKLLRMLVYQNDWKVLPMSALVAGLVGMVIRNKLFISMEGTVMGSFALVCVCLWNGAFNSIQVICRERDVIKREHRSGMHISSYIFSHMICQLLICAAQTAITLYVTRMIGVEYPAKGMFTPWMMVDLGISMLLITYASDMLSLWVSTLARTTTTAMTIMPFVLIFQLVFSGGMLTLPNWTKPLTHFTVSNPGLRVIAAQADTNNRSFKTVSDLVRKMKNEDIDTAITLGQIMDILTNTESSAVAKLREKKYGGTVTVGEIIDKVAADPDAQAYRNVVYPIHTTVGELIELVGEEQTSVFLEERAAKASYMPEYENTRENIIVNWLHIGIFIACFALLAMVTLEFIDKDKR